MPLFKPLPASATVAGGSTSPDGEPSLNGIRAVQPMAPRTQSAPSRRVLQGDAVGAGTGSELRYIRNPMTVPASAAMLKIATGTISRVPSTVCGGYADPNGLR